MKSGNGFLFQRESDLSGGMDPTGRSACACSDSGYGNGGHTGRTVTILLPHSSIGGCA